MLGLIIRRLIILIPTIFLISVIAFMIIQLPPGDYLTTLVVELESSGQPVDKAQLESLRRRYGLGQPFYIQYFYWIKGIILEGDFGTSFQHNRPVKEIIMERLPLTIIVQFFSITFVWIVGLLIGAYSAAKQYSVGDYIFTFFGFLGLAIPNFMLALILIWISYSVFGMNVGGLFSSEFVGAPWGIPKFIDLLQHIWVPVVVIGTAGTAGTIRILRANLLDELGKPYVKTARAKGLPETRIFIKYPLRIALNPFISTVGWTIPRLISGGTIVSVVLNLPTTGPVLLQSLLTQDMFVAGAFVMLLSILTVLGTMLSDILLAIADPRIRYNQ